MAWGVVLDLDAEVSMESVSGVDTLTGVLGQRWLTSKLG